MSKVKGECKTCGVPIKTSHNYCLEHRPKYFDWENATIAEGQARHKHQFYNRIRELSRRRFQKLFSVFSCQNCGYDKFVEVCHIHAISSFPKDTLVSVVNADENIVLLCPNCHWEFDNGLLDIGQANVSYLDGVEFKDQVCRTCKRTLQRQEPSHKRRPPKEQLLEDINTLSNCAIARKYGVTPQTVRRWLRVLCLSRA